MNQDYPEDLRKAIDFHGHFCPGLAIGYRAAKAAMEKLQVERAEDEELVAIVETDACGIDAVQSLLGCTIGKGNLFFRDYGKQAYTIASRSQNKAVRVVMTTKVFTPSAAQENLRSAVFGGCATAEQQREFQTMQQEKIRQLLTMDTDRLFKIETVEVPLPQPAKIFGSVTCDFCGESVMEPRARLREGKIACLSCNAEYSRSWPSTP
ncbi:MAG: FmdE family protein [Negativicutes bacterium]|nr:FmdE family protein [Negativicutes bacterium]